MAKKEKEERKGFLGKTKGFFSDIKSDVMNLALESVIPPEKLDKMFDFVRKGIESWMCEKDNEKIVIAKPNKNGTVSVFIVKKSMAKSIDIDMETEKPVFNGDLKGCMEFLKDYALADSSLSKMVDVS